MMHLYLQKVTYIDIKSSLAKIGPPYHYFHDHNKIPEA